MGREYNKIYEKKVTVRKNISIVHWREDWELSSNNREQCWPSKCASSLSSSTCLLLCSLSCLFLFCLHGRIYLMLPGPSMSRYRFLFPLLCWWVFDARVQGPTGLCCGPFVPFPCPHLGPAYSNITKMLSLRATHLTPSEYCPHSVIVWSTQGSHDFPPLEQQYALKSL